MNKTRLKVGDSFTNSQGYVFEVIEYISCSNVLVEFKEPLQHRTRAHSSAIFKGFVKNKYHPTLYGVGFIGDGLYTYKNHKQAYTTWTNMLQRGYCSKYKAKNKTYKGCSVISEWHNFQNFATWYYENYIVGFSLDKDILGDGQLYSPSTCCFVPPEINSFFIATEDGVCFAKREEKYQVSIKYDNCNRFVGYYSSYNDALASYREQKAIKAKCLAIKYENFVAESVIIKLKEWENIK